MHLPALQELERFLPQRRFPGSVAHFRHSGLVGGEFGVYLGEFDVEAVDVGFGLDMGGGGQR